MQQLPVCNKLIVPSGQKKKSRQFLFFFQTCLHVFLFLLHTIAVLLLGEAVRWETNLQLIIDLLITNGHPYSSPVSLPKKHIPVIVANTDLIYMSEAPLSRYCNCYFCWGSCNLDNLLFHKLPLTAFIAQDLLPSGFLNKLSWQSTQR